MVTRVCIKIVTICDIFAYFTYIEFMDYIKIILYNIFVVLNFHFDSCFLCVYLEFPTRNLNKDIASV